MERYRASAMTACLGALTLLAGCGSGGPPASPPQAASKAPPASAAKAPAPPLATKAPTAATAAGPQGGPAAPGPASVPAFAYDPHGRRDPFRPLIVARVATPRPKTGLASLDPVDLKLTGVVWDQRGYYALVEAPNGLGYVIRTNDVIGDEAKVTKISPEGMTLEMEARAELPREKGQKRLVEIRLRKEKEEER